MNKLMNWMESTLVPLANKFSQNAILKTISGGMMKLLPIIMAGSIFSIFQSIPWDPYTNFMESTGLATLIGYIPTVTTGMLSVYVAYSVGSEGIKNFGHPNESFISGMLSLMGYLMLVPVVDDTVGTSYLGTQGIFVALICGVLEAAILNWVLNKNITIKMPAGVPPMIGDSFAALIPAFIIGAVFALIKWGFSFTPYGNPVDCIYTIIQTPLQSLTSSLPAFLLLLLIAQVLWFFGVHGSYSVLPILFPMWFAFAAENAELAAAGQPITNCLNAAMWDLACLGGAGSTIGLVILLFFKSKSARYKEFGKLTLPCGIFGVNEPVIFGLPVMLNPLMFIPFIITPVIIVSLAYFLIQIGIVAAPIGIVGAGSIPPFIHGLVNGSWTFAVYELVAVVISVVIYYPFFKVLDAQALKEEAQAEKE